MNATETLLILILIRIVIPFGLLLSAGELAQRRQGTGMRRL